MTVLIWPHELETGMGLIDTDALKHDHPIERIVERYGIELRPRGCALIGRCPFHDDGGRPNFHVYPAAESWYCYRCGTGGDVISFVERIDGLGFRDAVTRLRDRDCLLPSRTRRSGAIRSTLPRRERGRDPAERACLVAAVDLYHNRLLTDPTAEAYLQSRGVDGGIIDRCRIGYAAGDELAAYLHWRRLSIGAAMRVGLLTRDGREFLAGRVVVPEIRAGQLIWLIGRIIDPDDDQPKYLGLPGRKPLLGWELAKDSPGVFLVEGVFDLLTLVKWGYPALALVGTHARPEVLRALSRFEHISVVFDTDQPGRVAAKALVQGIGRRAASITLHGVKDVAELAAVPDGGQRFVCALDQSEVARAA